MVQPLARGRGRRGASARGCWIKGAARRGGMPLYKYVGNRILTTHARTPLVGTGPHRVPLRLPGLQRRPRCATIAVDAQLRRVRLRHRDHHRSCTATGKRIVEIPIPTYYGDEICYVNGMQYAARRRSRRRCVYRLRTAGLHTRRARPASTTSYELREPEGSSHAVILDMVAGCLPVEVLDIGCSGGLLGRALRRPRSSRRPASTLVDARGRRRRCRRVLRRPTSSEGIPDELDGTASTWSLARDVLEHVREPRRAAARAARRARRRRARSSCSVPNFGHWYPRVRVALGQLRLRPARHPRREPRALLHPSAAAPVIKKNGFTVSGGGAAAGRRRRREVVVAGEAGARVASTGSRSGCGPTMFAYQFVVEIEPVRHRAPSCGRARSTERTSSQDRPSTGCRPGHVPTGVRAGNFPVPLSLNTNK